MTRLFLFITALVAFALPANARPLSIAEISQYLNAMRSAKASFVQANPDNTLAQGVLYLSKPGRIRYEYTAPNDSLVIADGRAIAVFDRKSNRGPQQYDLKKTPLDLLLRDQLNLQATGFVRDIQSDGTQTRVVATDPENRQAGSIAMIFTSNPVELRQWIVTDRRGKQTTVILSDLRVTNNVPSRLFDIAATAKAMGK